MLRGRVLVVDDDQSICSYISTLLTSSGYHVDSLNSGDEAVAFLEKGLAPDILLLDLAIPGMGGLDVLDRAREINASMPIIMLTANGQVRTVVEAMRLGASDYLTKPFDDQELESAIENALKSRGLKVELPDSHQPARPQPSTEDIVSCNAAMSRIRQIARHVADVDVPVLILGESGVGKEVVARLIHAQSKRCDKPFVKVNCAALPHDLLESELFGYQRGAFTGAQTDKPGKFEQAGAGSILLDEIGEMSPQLQAKLLHVLQDGEYARLGGRRNMRSEARILASTNKQLDKAVALGEFRADLYFRLNVIRLDIPPLRARTEDIPLYCNYFLQKYRERYKSSIGTIPRELLEAFAAYPWPGNVRQLENVVKRYLILGDLEMVLKDFKCAPPAGNSEVRSDLSLKTVAANAAEQAERDAILAALEETHWNRKKAAHKLGICYKALLNKLKKWQIDNRPAAFQQAQSAQAALPRQPGPSNPVDSLL